MHSTSRKPRDSSSSRWNTFDGRPVGYQVYDSLQDLRRLDAFDALDATEKARVFDDIAAALGERWATWID